jgi:glucose-6-phosphate isomerase
MVNFTFEQTFYNIDFADFKEDYFNNLQQEIINQNKNKGIFDLPNRYQSYLKKSLEISNEIKSKYKNLVICGMGGSSLGAKTLCGNNFYDAQHHKFQNKIYFIDNIHYHNLCEFLKILDFDKTAFLFISKSGRTIETICQTLFITDYYQNKLKNNESENLYFLTENRIENNPLFKIAKKHNRKIIDHDQDIGGRYSCFTPVALIPAAFYEIDIKKYLDGAFNIIFNFINKTDNLITKGVYFLQQSQKKNLNIQVSMPYLSRLYHFNYWYNQLLAESIGKNGLGITPLKAVGSVDQHSVLQLFLDGPKDKFFTFLTSNHQNKGNQIIVPNYLKSDLKYLENNRLGDVIYANQEATIKTIKNKNHPIRKFNFDNLDESGFGEIMMYFMLETIFYAKLLNVNPFDQPAVEEGKIFAKETLIN